MVVVHADAKETLARAMDSTTPRVDEYVSMTAVEGSDTEFHDSAAARRNRCAGRFCREIMRSVRIVTATAFIMCTACATPPASASWPAPAPIELVVAAEPQAPPAPDAAAPVAALPPIDLTAPSPDPPPPLPKIWMELAIPKLSYAEAIAKARASREAFGRLTAPPKDAPDPLRRGWFTRAMAHVDHASRQYAAAFHAVDASREGRIDAISEAAELELLVAKSLDDQGLDVLPTAWRSDAAVASTFEDVAVGPSRRWRDDGRALARQCIQTASEQAVTTEAAKRCALLRSGQPTAHKASGCGCDPGDPLCSASLGGWCGSK